MDNVTEDIKAGELGDMVVIPRVALAGVRKDLEAAMAKLDQMETFPTMETVIDRMVGKLQEIGALATITRLPHFGTQKRFKIGRWDHSYADVVYRTMGDDPFDTDAAWTSIEPVIDSDSKVHRSSMVRSLRSDKRFKEVDMGQPGLWFMKSSSDQLEMEEDPE